MCSIYNRTEQNYIYNVCMVFVVIKMLIIYLYENIEMFMQDSDPQPIVWQLNEVDIQILLKNHDFVHIVKILLRYYF